MGVDFGADFLHMDLTEMLNRYFPAYSNVRFQSVLISNINISCKRVKNVIDVVVFFIFIFSPLTVGVGGEGTQVQHFSLSSVLMCA